MKGPDGVTLCVNQPLEMSVTLCSDCGSLWRTDDVRLDTCCDLIVVIEISLFAFFPNCLCVDLAIDLVGFLFHLIGLWWKLSGGDRCHILIVNDVKEE